jgi:hypothetical protein
MNPYHQVGEVVYYVRIVQLKVDAGPYEGALVDKSDNVLSA